MKLALFSFLIQKDTWYFNYLSWLQWCFYLFFFSWFKTVIFKILTISHGTEKNIFYLALLKITVTKRQSWLLCLDTFFRYGEHEAGKHCCLADASGKSDLLWSIWVADSPGCRLTGHVASVIWSSVLKGLISVVYRGQFYYTLQMVIN